ncbi:uncharacterized protein LOC111830634 [Capsella rubella]|uniref:uncharacterized protein LOC111830634 n=1 Tax=Capsella rubella TaxID=81985 RepID=UPI000CD54161|nr:uncharacterized protein LOC111830634 [Capsella rubella]
MEPITDGVGTRNNIVLDTKRYGYWKVRMTQLIRGQGEDAWTAVEEGWESPFELSEDGAKIPKPKARWTVDEKNMSKFNARAMNAIFSGVDEDEFKLIQGCKSAKQAWDTLQKSHEGTSSVKRTRLDHLATQFECLQMEPDETIVKFSSKISAIANEAEVLGKTYKDQKLVKKLLRCLPAKFAAHKAVMRVAGNTDSMTFVELVGILKSEEMENDEDKTKVRGNIAFQAEQDVAQFKEIKDTMAVLARNLKKALKRVKKTNGRNDKCWNGTEEDKSGGKGFKLEVDHTGKKSKIQCYQCGGFGHIKPECPVTKRNDLNCLECKGMGHTKFECPNQRKEKEKACLSFSDSDTEEEKEELLNFVAFTAPTDKTADSDTDSESGDEVNTKEEYKILYDSWIQLSKDKLELTQQKLSLEAKLESCYEKGDPEDALVLSSEQSAELLLKKIKSIQDDYYKEKEKADALEQELNNKHKQIRMLNSGSGKLDTILTMGRTESIHRGLGYQGQAGYSGMSEDLSIKFVSGGILEEKDTSVITPKNVPKHEDTKQKRKGENVHKRIVRRPNKGRFYGCGYCGRKNHQRKYCYKFKERVSVLWTLNKCFLEPSKFGCIWVVKKDLYGDLKKEISNLEISDIYNAEDEVYSRSGIEMSRNLHEKMTDSINLNCNLITTEVATDDKQAEVAYTTAAAPDDDSWYFDSGCSRHMTGNQTALDEYSSVSSGRVTFGDDQKGSIKGKGVINKSNQPQLENVYCVEGLKANLISISQLCDDGLKVTFTKTACHARDENDNEILSGIRSENNCYMWKKSESCLSTTTSKLDLWQKRLVHINTQSLIKIVNAEVVKRVPRLERKSDTVCDACSKGEQIKVHHKKVADIGSKGFLELVHMDLMGPMQIESSNGKRYIFVLVDDFSTFTLVRFLRKKSETLESFRILALQLQTEKGSIVQIRRGHGGEFQNAELENFCNSQGIRHQYSAPRTPQQSGIVKTKNRTLQEMARAMIHGNNVLPRFWAEAVNTEFYIINRVYVKSSTCTTPYEIWKEKTPNLCYFHTFRCICYILNDKDLLGKFNARSDGGIFLGYATKSMAYRVYNKRLKRVDESVNVVLDDKSPAHQYPVAEDDESPTETPGQEKQEGEQNGGSDEQGNLGGNRTTRGVQINFRETLQQSCFVSVLEPKDVFTALKDKFWFAACHEELHQFTRHDVWNLVPKPAHGSVIGTKWISKTKIDKDVNVMTKEFEMSLVGEMNYFLGLQIKQAEDGIHISQGTYAKSLVLRFRMQTRSWLYLTASRPDMCSSVGVCARYQADPKLSHMNAEKRIIKYVKGTFDQGFYDTKQTNKNLASFCDSDWAGNLDDRRNASGGCVFLGKNLISWHSKKQSYVTRSTAETEYIALESCCTELMWMKQMLSDYGIVSSTLLVYCDNMSAINISKNPVQLSRTKHIDIMLQFVRELVENKIIEISHVSSEKQLVDIFTKPLELDSFINLQKSIGLLDH